MAFREIRIIFHSEELGKSKELNLSIGAPFEWYMDGVMRGRFREYSGDEVQGISLVNFCLYSPGYVAKMKSGSALKQEWLNLLNTYHYELEYDLSQFSGTREENIYQAIELFLKHAEELKVPAMENLVAHAKQSIGVQSLSKAIAKADSKWQEVLQYVGN